MMPNKSAQTAVQDQAARLPPRREEGEGDRSIAGEGLVPELISDTLKENFDLTLYTDVNL